MRPRKYHVELTETEHKELNDLTNKGKVSAIKIKHAQILLKLDECTEEKPWAVADISKAFNISERTVCSIAKRFVEDGLECALERKKQLNRHHKITGDIEAKIIAIACSEAPEGYNRWILQMIADKLIELKVIDSISSAAVGTALKKMNLNHGLLKNGVSQNPERNS